MATVGVVQGQEVGVVRLLPSVGRLNVRLGRDDGCTRQGGKDKQARCEGLHLVGNVADDGELLPCPWTVFLYCREVAASDAILFLLVITISDAHIIGFSISSVSLFALAPMDLSPRAMDFSPRPTGCLLHYVVLSQGSYDTSSSGVLMPKLDASLLMVDDPAKTV